MGVVTISIPAGGENPPKGTNPSTTRDPSQTEERANLEHPVKEIRDHTAESNRTPTIEIYPTKTASKVKHPEAQKQPIRLNLNGETKKEHAIKRNGRFPTKKS